MKRIAVATDHGVVFCVGDEDRWRPESTALDGHTVTSIIAREGIILAGTRAGVFRGDGNGGTWLEVSRGLDNPLVRWLAFHPDISDREFAGTEPAGIFVSHDGGDSWRACSEVTQLRDRGRWFLPYSPEAGCVRGFAFHGSRIYAAVEVGGVLRSDDYGENWRLVEGATGIGTLDQAPDAMVHSDVHSIVSHASSPDLVLAATNSGLFISEDGGATWTNRYPHAYCRAVWIDPLEAAHIVLGPADDVSRNGRIERSIDGGRTWQSAAGGLDLPWPRCMIERFFEIGSQLFAVTDDGRAFVSDVKGMTWRRIVPDLTGITGVAAI